MKTVIKSLLIGIIVAIAGLVFSDAFSVIINGMDRNASTLLGMGVYICITLVVCTGVILGQINKK